MHKIWILKFYSHLQNKSHLLACICGILKRERLWKEVDIMFDGFARASVPMLARALVSASDWEPPVLTAYPFCNVFVKIWLLVFAVRRLTISERMRTFMEKLSDLCRDQKQTITPRKTNQDIAESTDLSVGTVAQFFRGDIKNPSVYTAGPICREMGVSMDAYFDIPREASPPDPDAVSAEADNLRIENAALHEQLRQQQKSLRMHRLVTLILLSIVALCAFALVVDILSPTLGWFRA